MIARGFKPVAWVAAIGSAALGCYMLSLQVAAERAELAALERRIVGARQDIRALETELGTRGRLSQLEAWNAEVLALSAPVSGQYLESNLSLARFDAGRPTLAGPAEIQLAAAEAAPAALAPQPQTQLSAAQPGVRLAVAAASPAAVEPSPPVLRRASLEVPPPAAAPARAVQGPGRATPAARQLAVPSRAEAGPGGLLGADTLADLRAESRSERAGGTRN